MFSYHGKIALVTLAFLTIAGIYLFSPSTGTPDAGTVIDIGIEHSKTLTVALSLTEGTERSLIDMDLTSDETSYVTVPRGWKRMEARRAPLSAVAGRDADANMRTWTLPANAGISFSTDDPFKTLKLHNPSGVPVKIQLTRVNLAKQTSSYDVFLLKDGSLKLP